MENMMSNYHDDSDYDEPDEIWSDEYERYEDQFLESGYDPYGLFDALLDVPRVERLLRSIRALKRQIGRILLVLRIKRRDANVDDIPF